MLRRICFAMNGDSEEEADTADSEGAEDLERIMYTIYDEDSDGEGGSDGDVEDLFSFDLDRVAMALQRGAGKEELTQVIQELLGDELESRLAAGCTEIFVEPPTAEVPPKASTATSGTATPLMGGNLSGLMTPLQLLPGETSPVPSPEDISSRLGQVFGRFGDCIPEQRRHRSSALQHPRLADAIGEANERRRQSFLAGAGAGRRLSMEAAKRAATECRLHRLSLLRAAEVLEVARIGVEGEAGEEDKGEPNVVSEQLHLVQDALKSARRRHRLSVAQAVREVAQEGKQAAKLPCQNLAYEKIQQIIAKAYAQRQETATKGKSAAPAGVGNGSIVALVHARAGDVGQHRVHVGPARKLAAGGGGRSRGLLAVRLGGP